MAELEREDHGGFVSNLRMELATFHKLCIYWRKPLSPGLKLAMTLRFFATGNRLSHSECHTVLRFVIATFTASAGFGSSVD